MFAVAGHLVVMKTLIDDELAHFYAQGTIQVRERNCFINAWFIPGQINTPSTEIYLALQPGIRQRPCYFRFLRAVPLSQFHFTRVAELLRTHIPKQLDNTQKNTIPDELGAEFFALFEASFLTHSMMMMNRLACTDQSLAIENRNPSVQQLEDMEQAMARIEEKSDHIEQHLIAPKKKTRTRTATDNRAICKLYDRAVREAAPERYSFEQFAHEKADELTRYHVTSATAARNAVRAHRAAESRKHDSPVAAHRPAHKKVPPLTRNAQLFQRLP